LDRPLGEQYVEYLKNIAKGDLGASMKVRGRTVNDVINKSFFSFLMVILNRYYCIDFS